MTQTVPPALAVTRGTWHRVAEHVLAAGQFAAAGTIRLRPWTGGIGTVVGVDGRQLAVLGDHLVVVEPDGRRRSTPLTTVGAAAVFAGVRAGLQGTYPPATSADPDTPLPVDVTAARELAAWYALGETALGRLAGRLGSTQQPVLWPEHLDLGITVDAVNYGCSPGDAAIPAPYLYVGPHSGAPRRDDFWNAPFGAAVTADRISGAEAAVDFFQHGRSLTQGSAT
jgi:hypothetical protein